jgi:DNA-binding beta-propeller fold protein YncE
MMLVPSGFIEVPPHTASEFDHGDVHLASGQVFVAHTATGTVEVLDGIHRRHSATIPGCVEASGVLVAQEAGIVFAASRGAGQVLVIDVATHAVRRRIGVDPRPNGLAWDAAGQRLSVADVQENTARLVSPDGETLAVTALPGRPRWCAYDATHERFLVNIREPAGVAVLEAAYCALQDHWPMPSVGPHGLDLDLAHQRGYIACDGGQVVQLNLADGVVTGQAAIAGAPDAVWHDARRQRLYVAIGDPGVVQVIDTQSMQVVQTLATEHGAHTTAFDRERQMVYVFLPATCRAGVFAEFDEGEQA